MDNNMNRYSEALGTMDQNKDVSSFEFAPKTKMLFAKKFLRRLLKVSATRQEIFNNAATNITTGLTQDVQRTENTIQDLQEKLQSRAEVLDRLESRTNELQGQLEHYSAKATDYQSQLQRVLEKLEGMGILLEGDDKLSWVKRSSSQAGEDAILEFVFGTLHIPLEECDYIDLGANHPFYLSNTNFFYQKGAKGILVEANPQLIPDLKFYRSRDLVLNRFVSNNSGETIEFYLMNVDGLSTSSYESVIEFKKENPALEVVDTVKVESISVNEIMENYLGHAPKILNIDLEGLELEVLNNIDFERFRPLAILVEMIPYKTSLVTEQKNKDVVELMEKKGYTEYAFTGINSIFLDKEQVK